MGRGGGGARAPKTRHAAPELAENGSTKITKNREMKEMERWEVDCLCAAETRGQHRAVKHACVGEKETGVCVSVFSLWMIHAEGHTAS